MKMTKKRADILRYMMKKNITNSGLDEKYIHIDLTELTDKQFDKLILPMQQCGWLKWSMKPQWGTYWMTQAGIDAITEHDKYPRCKYCDCIIAENNTICQDCDF